MTLTPSRPGPYVAFKRHVRAVEVDGDAVHLLTAGGTTVLQGPGSRHVASLLDGNRTLAEVLREAAETMGADEAGELLRRLGQANLVGYRPAAPGGEAVPPDEDSWEAYWDLAGLNGAVAAGTGRQPAVAILTVGDGAAEAAARACRTACLTPVRTPADADLTVVLCSDYLAPVLHDVDARLRAGGHTWLLAKAQGVQTWVGPVLGLPDGPCWECLAHRLRGHRRNEQLLQRALGLPEPPPPPDPSPGPVHEAGLRLAALEAAKWLAGHRSARQRELSVLDSLHLTLDHHPVQRRPQCPQCSDPTLVAKQARRPVRLVSRPKAPGPGNNHRALDPDRMLSRYRHLVGPVTGVVPDIRPVAGLPGLYRYDSGPNLALDGGSPDMVRQRLRARSGGKGVTPQEAEAGALGEAMERHCGSRHGDELTVHDTLAGLGDTALHPNAVQLFHERQYPDRERWNQRHSAFHRISPPFDAHRPTNWTPVWCPAAGDHRLLPTSLLYFHTGPGDATDGLWADSNGNAAGSSLEDAFVQGFLELVERDAVALWWYNRTRHAGLDLDAFDAPWLSGAREAFARSGRRVWALDLTSDLGIPVVAAVSRRTDDDAQHILFGFGAHHDPRLALRRAMTEMAQLIPPPAWSVDQEEGPGGDRDLAAWWRGGTTARHPYLLPDPGQRPQSPAAWTYRARQDLLEDVEDILRLVGRHGLELMVLDQTRPDIGVPVVKVIVPGLRHFWARFGPGRLYDVPVRLGRLREATPYEGLNPLPLFV